MQTFNLNSKLGKSNQWEFERTLEVEMDYPD